MSNYRASIYAMAIVFFYLALFLAWQMIADYQPSWAFIFPKPSQVLAAFSNHNTLLTLATLQTFWQSVVGLLLGAVVALLLALVLQPLPWLKQLLYPALYAWQASPTMVTTSLVLLWFGFGTPSKLILIMLVTFFPIYVAFSQALLSVDEQWVTLLRSYGANRWQCFKLARWPLALVGFFSGLRVASTYLVSVTITAQWLGGQDGLGNILLRSRRSYDYALMMATVSLSIALSLLFIWLSIALERWMSRRYHLEK